MVACIVSCNRLPGSNPINTSQRARLIPTSAQIGLCNGLLKPERWLSDLSLHDYIVGFEKGVGLVLHERCVHGDIH